MKIYLASSWRNLQQPTVLAALRAANFQVYDFKNPAPGNTGFGWKQCTDTPPPWSAAQTIEVLNSPIANAGFCSDFDAMKWCDALVMLQPCGRSAAMELGWAAGAGKITVALLADGQEPELMVKMADHLCDSVENVIRVLAPRRDRCTQRIWASGDTEDCGAETKGGDLCPEHLASKIANTAALIEQTRITLERLENEKTQFRSRLPYVPGVTHSVSCRCHECTGTDGRSRF